MQVQSIAFSLPLLRATWVSEKEIKGLGWDIKSQWAPLSLGASSRGEKLGPHVVFLTYFISY